MSGRSPSLVGIKLMFGSLEPVTPEPEPDSCLSPLVPASPSCSTAAMHETGSPLSGDRPVVIILGALRLTEVSVDRRTAG